MNTRRTQYGTVRGLRGSTPQSTATRQAADDFDGLPPGVTRSDLMRAVEDGGRWCGLTGVQIRRLVYLVRHTAEIDWQDEGTMPVVWVSVSKMAHDFGVSRQRIAAVERQLAEAGWVSHRDAPDRRRRGERDPETGRIVDAWGIELGALGARYGELAEAALRCEADWVARRDLKQSSSALRCEIRQFYAAFDGKTSSDEAPTEALPGDAPLEALEDEHAALRSLRDRLADRLAALAPPRPVTGGGETRGLPAQTPDTHPILLQTESRVPDGNRPVRSDGGADPAGEASTEDPPDPTGDDGPRRNKTDPNVDFGIQHVDAGRVAAVASESWQREADGEGWRGNAWACEVVRPALRIGDKAWFEAVQVLGIRAAVVVVAIIDGRCQDRATHVRNPSAFLMGCVRRARTGDLRLHRSIWGLEARKRRREAGWPYAGEGAATGAAP